MEVFFFCSSLALAPSPHFFTATHSQAFASLPSLPQCRWRKAEICLGEALIAAGRGMWHAASGVRIMCATEEDEPPRCPPRPWVGVPAEDRSSKTFTLGRGGAHKSSRCSPTASDEGQRTETNGHGSPHAGTIDHEGVDETSWNVPST